MNNRLKTLIRLRNQAGKAWRQALIAGDANTQEKWGTFKRRLAGVAAELSKDARRKRMKWRIKSLEHNSSSSRTIWRDLRSKGGKVEIRALKTEAGITVVNPVEIRGEIGRYMSELGRGGLEVGGEGNEAQEQTGNRNIGGRVPHVELEGREDVLEGGITVDECGKAIKALKIGKAIGDDRIANQLLREGGVKLWEAVTVIMEQIRQEEWIPESWKGERVTLLHKGKSRLSLDNYRGIAIGSNMCKVFTRIIRSRVQTIAEENGILGEMQNGFRKGRSANDNLLVLRHLIERSQRKGRRGVDLTMVFIDLRKAYDRVWRAGVWEVLRKLGFGEKVVGILIRLYNGHKRRVQTIAGLTDWILCTIGLKQGCVLSPLLFALFIAELEKRIQELGIGVRVGGKTLGGLLFADDLVLMAENVGDLKRLVEVTNEFMHERKLEINVGKSASMRVGRKRAEGVKIKITRDGKEEEMEEVNVYKYLGVKLGNNRIFGYQMDEVVKNFKWKIASLKAKAGDLPDVVAGSDIVWNRAMRPALLYGAEIIEYSKTWVKKLEVAQNQVARWLTGTSQRASRVGLSGEMGWRKMETEIWERKLVYYGVVQGMAENRWAKIILKEMEEDPSTKSWLATVKGIMLKVGITYAGQSPKQWKSLVKKAVRGWEMQSWKSDKESHEGLKEYPKDKLGKREEYLNYTKMSKMLCKFRLDDLDPVGQGVRCQVCGEVTVEIRTHILTACPELENSRGDIEWLGVNRRPGEAGWVREVLEDSRNIPSVTRLGLAWKEKGGGS